MLAVCYAVLDALLFSCLAEFTTEKQDCSGRGTDVISIVLRNTYHWNGLWGVAL